MVQLCVCVCVCVCVRACLSALSRYLACAIHRLPASNRGIDERGLVVCLVGGRARLVMGVGNAEDRGGSVGEEAQTVSCLSAYHSSRFESLDRCTVMVTGIALLLALHDSGGQAWRWVHWLPFSLDWCPRPSSPRSNQRNSEHTLLYPPEVRNVTHVQPCFLSKVERMMGLSE